MAFQDGCACHVWAIDGYTNDQRAANVNALYANESTRILVENDQDFIGQLDLLVAHLVRHCRRNPATGDICVIYGGFQNAGDGAPEHMWLEYNGFIYDTMPGAMLRRVVANDLTRLRPPSEQQAFDADLVGRMQSTLTVSQRRIINNSAAAFQAGDDYDPPELN